jgi:replicative DNA helicase
MEDSNIDYKIVYEFDRVEEKLEFVNQHETLTNVTTLPDLESFGGMSYLSELLSYADLEKFEGMEKLIVDIWNKLENRSILTVAAP